MEQTDREAARLLGPLREAGPETGPGVDIERAIRTGRRRKGARLAVRAAVAAAVTALAVAGLPNLVAGWSGGAGDLRVASAPTEFDVRRQEFGIGSAGGFTPYAFETGKYRQRAYLKPDRSTDPAAPAATATLYAGRQFDPAGDPAPPVHDRRAVWLDTPGRAEIAWEWTDGAWAVASVPADLPDARDRAHRVAQSVEPDASTPVQIPFRVETPGVWTGVVSAIGKADRKPSVRVVFETPDAPGEPVSAGIRPKDPGAVADDQVGGRPAVVTETSVTILDLGQGLSGFVSADRPGRLGADQLRQLAATLHLGP
ncbi:hypothetical protein [Amycolatopsis anabasis]|uniref:hypothetical protein n=1 Tax=Amycolatopsis anabasis TaxID=1840409 RepID=UPI00131C659F|nr:hypothetical protein [Amycolatopsis anabasis]